MRTTFFGVNFHVSGKNLHRIYQRNFVGCVDIHVTYYYSFPIQVQLPQKQARSPKSATIDRFISPSDSPNSGTREKKEEFYCDGICPTPTQTTSVFTVGTYFEVGGRRVEYTLSIALAIENHLQLNRSLKWIQLPT